MHKDLDIFDTASYQVKWYVINLLHIGPFIQSFKTTDRCVDSRVPFGNSEHLILYKLSGIRNIEHRDLNKFHRKILVFHVVGMDSALWMREKKPTHKHTRANVMNALLVQSSFAWIVVVQN